MERFFEHIRGNGTWAIARSRNPVRTGQWTHVVGTYDDRVFKVFIDSRLADAASEVSFQSLTTAIGCNSFGGKGAFCNGLIDEVRLDDRALDSVQ